VKVVYAVTQNIVFALDSSTGLAKWSRTIGGSALGPPTVAEDGTIYTYFNTTVYAVTDNGTTSTLKWSLGVVGTTSAFNRYISVGNIGRLYLVTNTEVVSITDNGASAVTNWVYTVNPALAPGALTSPTISLNGTIYVTGDYTLIICLTDTGLSFTLNWAVQVAGGQASQFTIGLNQRCYLGNDQTGIICY
jgi:hypothetical protein